METDYSLPYRKCTLIGVIISKTSKSLWQNVIPNELYKLIYAYAPELKSKEKIHSLCRHHPVLLYAFRQLYGPRLESCDYAGIVKVPNDFINIYKVCHIPCFGNSYYPESIDLCTEKWLPKELEDINNQHHLSQEMKNYYETEAKQYSKKKSHLFL